MELLKSYVAIKSIDNYLYKVHAPEIFTKGIIVNGWKQGTYYNNYGGCTNYLNNIRQGISYEIRGNKLFSLCTYKDGKQYCLQYEWYINGILKKIDDFYFIISSGIYKERATIYLLFHNNGKIKSTSYVQNDKLRIIHL